MYMNALELMNVIESFTFDRRRDGWLADVSRKYS